jgi:hypothetical protein
MEKEVLMYTPIFETEVKGLGKVQFFKDDEKNCCWFTVNRKNGFCGWTAAKPDPENGTIKFYSVNSIPVDAF